MLEAQSFKIYVLEQLSGLSEVSCRAMFGGHGLYCSKRFFGILHRSRLHLKTDTTTRRHYIRAGSKPFQPSPDQTLGSYYEVPAAILEDAPALQTWAAQAAAIEK
jgi:DNA transformation protein